MSAPSGLSAARGWRAAGVAAVLYGVATVLLTWPLFRHPGTTVLEMRYASPHIEDDFYVYVPSLRRIRRVPPIQRCATIAPGSVEHCCARC